MTIEQIERKYELLFKDYVKFIRPQRKRADLLVQIDCSYSFTRVDAIRHRDPPPHTDAKLRTPK